jgi:hypothetical protein
VFQYRRNDQKHRHLRVGIFDYDPSIYTMSQYFARGFSVGYSLIIKFKDTGGYTLGTNKYKTPY